MRRRFIFGDNSLAVARKICQGDNITIECTPKSEEAVNDVRDIYQAIRRANIVSPQLANLPTSI